MGGRGVWEACLGPTLALAHPLGHGGYLRRRHPACQAPMHFLAISSGIPGGARPAVRHGATAEGHQKVNHSIPTAPNSYKRVQLKARTARGIPSGALSHPGAGAAPAPRPQLTFCPLAGTALAQRASICWRGRKLICEEAGSGRPVLDPPWR